MENPNESQKSNSNVVIVQQPSRQIHPVQDDSVSLVDVAFKCLHHWYWILFSIVLFTVLGIYYAKSQEKIYTRAAAIMIKSDSKPGGNSSGINMDAANEMGLFSNTSDVDNELIAIQSPSMLPEVIKRLNLNMNYSTDGTLHRVTLYGKTLPVEVKLLDVQETEVASLTITLHGDNTFTVSDLSKTGAKPSKAVLNGKLGSTIKTPIGRIQVTKHSTFNIQHLTLSKDVNLYVSHPTMDDALTTVKSKLTASINGKKSSVIDLTYTDVNTQRAEDFLNTLISVYNENWVKDRNQIAIATNEFIADRINVIEQELGNVDQDISTYKSTNLIPDLQAASNMSLQEASEANKQTIDLNNQLAMTHYVRQYMTNSANSKKLIPANTGIGSSGIESQIEAYNTKMLERNSLAANSSESNGMVQDLDAELSAMHSAIVSSIDNQITALNTQVSSSRGIEARATGKLASNPTQAKHLLSVERQQSVKEALYTFLLQKREENELSQAFVAYNTRVITSPCGSNHPTGPKTQQIVLIAFLIGLCLPIGIIYLNEAMNTTIRGRKDLEHMHAPFLGEIPEGNYHKKSLWEKIQVRWELMRIRWGGQKEDHDSDQQLAILVKPGSRNVINEAFRVIRSNLKFNKKEKNQILMITSANAASGKTFVTLNLGASFAIQKTKVLLIDLDLRKRSLSKAVPNHAQGVVDYLAHRVETWDGLIQHSTQVEGLDILPVGALPPNPTELLNDDRLEQMLTQLRTQYDLILLDCPPVEVVADVSIIAPQVDKTIFLLRANLFQRSMLSEIDKIYEEKTYGNMTVLLNGTEDTYGKYGYSKYGYRYGYHYGYGSRYETGTDKK